MEAGTAEPHPPLPGERGSLPHDVHASLVLLQKEHQSFRVAVTGSRVHRRRQYLVAKEDRGPIVEQPSHEVVIDVPAVGWRSLQ
eukprot:SM000066S20418  [mRNA]  locus=s66:166691:167309:- [translate_table: standard]